MCCAAVPAQHQHGAPACFSPSQSSNPPPPFKTNGRLLVALLEGILYPKTYAPNLDGCHVEMRVLGKLLADKAPRLARHMHVRGWRGGGLV